MRTALQIPEWFPVAEAPLASPVDDYRIEAMVNGFIAGKQEALFTAPDAFYRLQAADAVQGRPAIAQRLLDLQTATLDQTRDNAERVALTRRLDLHLDDAMDGIDRHVAGQRRVHQRQIVSQRQALIQRAAELEHDNDDKIAGLAEANASAAIEGARMDGIAPTSSEELDAAREARSQVLRTAINERIAHRKGLRALALFDRVKEHLSSVDLDRLTVPVEAARNEAAADTWLQQEATKPGPPLTERAVADPTLSSDQKAIAIIKVLAEESAQESNRAVTVMELDDRLASARRALGITPDLHEISMFAKLAKSYADAGEPQKATVARRLALQEPFLQAFAQASPDRQQKLIDSLPAPDHSAAEAIKREQSEREKAAILRRMAVQDAFIMPFARASTDKQQQMTDELPEGELRDTAIAMQRDQVESFERDAFAAGTALYKEVGPPVPIDDVRGRIRQARQIAQRRGGISVAPFTLRELDDIQKILAEGSEQDKQTIRVYLAAVPADIRPPTEPKDVIAPTDPDGAATTGSTQTSQVDVPRLAALQSTDGVVDGNTSISEDDSRGPLTSDPVMTAQVVPPTIMFGRTPPSIGRPVPPPGTVPTPEGLTPFEQLPRGSSGGDRAGRPFPRKDNPYPEGTPCTYCGKPTTKRPGLPDTLEREHIIPRSRGGDGEPSNRAPSCRSCNREKSGRPPSEWYLWRWEEASAMPESYARIRFNLDPEDWHGETAELLWAEPIGPQGSRVFRLMNSPYHAHGVSYLDIVRAEEAPDGMGLDYAGTIEASGHSTVWLLVPSDSAVFARHWSSLHSRGCTYEGVVFDSKQTLYSVDVPPEANFDEIVSILDEGHRRGAWLFQIPHAGHAPNQIRHHRETPEGGGAGRQPMKRREPQTRS